MKFQYKTIIIGAGPAGAACALSLKQRGEDPCLIDKAVFPRHKTCAGLVTEKTYQLVKSLFNTDDADHLFCDTSSTVKLFRKSEELVSAKLKRPVHFADRTYFDNALVEEYKRIGGVIREGERDYQINYDNNSIALENGDEFNYQYLVFADGALSVARKLHNTDLKKMAFGIEAYIPTESIKIESVNLYFEYLKNGYVWAFPHGDAVCIGAANQYDPQLDYQTLFSSILADLDVQDMGAKRHGAFLPYGYIVPQKELPDHILLIGDAGGFTDPISGEGLYMSIKTGVKAADALASSAPKETYLKSVQPLEKIIKEGVTARDTFYSPFIQKLFYHKVKGKDKVVSYFFENMVHEYRYDYSKMTELYRDYKR